MIRFLSVLIAVVGLTVPAHGQSAFEQQNALLFQQLKREHRLTTAQLSEIKAIFARSGFVGQGNPSVARYAMTVEQCRARAPRDGKGYANRQFDRISAQAANGTN